MIGLETVDTSSRPGGGQGLGTARRMSQWQIGGAFAGAAVVSAAVVLLTGSTSIALWVVLTAVFGALTVYLMSWRIEGRRRAVDRLVTMLVTGAFLLALAPLISVMLTVLERGLRRLDIDFFTMSMAGVLGEGGGVYHALAGTLIITALASLISVPIGVMCAIYLVEYGRGTLKRAVTFFVDVMVGIPSIVAGLFAFALFALFFGPGAQFGLMGAVALSVLMIPIVVRSTEEILQLVPSDLREAAYALGVPKWRTITKVVLPTAAAGIASGVTLAIARIVGETAPLLVTVGLIASTNVNPFDGPMATLSVFAYNQYQFTGTPPEPFLDRAWAAALLLIVIVLVLNLIGRFIARAFAPKTR